MFSYPQGTQYREVCSKLIAIHPFLRDQSSSGYELLHESLKNKMKKERRGFVQEEEVLMKRAKFGRKGRVNEDKLESQQLRKVDRTVSTS
ncbi:Sterile alpha motif domain-containing protein 3 [Holothuria leucospilota]|uniref:Sterile alpha motif domain-containing protein 3 n=1 Tax=Holothuria leucospilota TaxID=206669 RepID=A0A9Q0YD86_HOLLE|nr:Sterile alpha motif domain-containing protein 3 [Holothuria leucospilota]